MALYYMGMAILNYIFILRSRNLQTLKAYIKSDLFPTKIGIKNQFNCISTHHHSICLNLKYSLQNEMLEILILWHLEHSCISLLRTT